MLAASSTSTLRTGRPLICIARICVAISPASSGGFGQADAPRLAPPPTSTCALTTTRPPSSSAICLASCRRHGHPSLVGSGSHAGQTAASIDTRAVSCRFLPRSLLRMPTGTNSMTRALPASATQIDPAGQRPAHRPARTGLARRHTPPTRTQTCRRTLKHSTRKASGSVAHTRSLGPAAR